MPSPERRTIYRWRPFLLPTIIAPVAFSAALVLAPLGFAAEAPVTITIDPSALVTPSWWQIPGVTPSIWSSDPETSDAFRTTDVKQLALRPGPYKFVSFTFDFPFRVTQEGTLEFPPSLDQCVSGRGTRTLIVTCKRTYPYGGKPDY